MGNTYSDQFKFATPALGDTGYDDELDTNRDTIEVFLAGMKQGNSVVSGLAPTDGGGLQIDWAAGVADVGDAKRSVGASNDNCTANQTNWLYVNSAGTMVLSTTAPTGDFLPIARIDAGAAAIDRIADLRFFGEVHIGYKADQVRHAVATGGTDAYVITRSPAPAALYDGQVVIFEADVPNTGACTLNDTGRGAKAIKKHNDQDLETGDIEAGQKVIVVYDATNTYYQMQSQMGRKAEGAILGDETAGRALRQATLYISDGTAATSIKVELSPGWNGNTVAEEDSLGKGGDTGNFNLSAGGDLITIEAGAITGNFIGGIAAVIRNNQSAVPLSTHIYVSGNNLKISCRHASTGAQQDFTTLVDTGIVYINLVYITSA